MASLADLVAYLPREDQLKLTGSAVVSRGNVRNTTGAVPVSPTVTAQPPPYPNLAASTTAPTLGQLATQTLPTYTGQQTTRQDVTTTGGGGSGGGGGGGSTGGGSTEQGGASSGLDLSQLTANELQSMLEYLSAQTGLTIAQLAQQAGAVGDAARLMMQQIGRQYQANLDAAQADALRRGIFHSGILAHNVGEVGQERALQEQSARGQAASKLADLQAQLDALVANNQLQAASAGSQILQSNLDPGQQAALQNQLAQLNLGAIPNVDLGQIANQSAGGVLNVGTPTNLGAPLSGAVPAGSVGPSSLASGLVPGAPSGSFDETLRRILGG